MEIKPKFYPHHLINALKTNVDYFSNIRIMILHSVFYFSSEVWGTVSDWVMIAVTAITLYYLRKTLQSQLEVQRTQTQLAEYEKHRFLLSIKPTFNTTTEWEDDYLIVQHHCTNATAKNTFVTIKGRDKYHFILNYTSNDTLEVNMALLSHIDIEKQGDIPILSMTIYFQDIQGNCYSQIANLFYPGGRHNPKATMIPVRPIELTEYEQQKGLAIENKKPSKPFR